MPLTYVNIASTTLGSSQTTVTFSGISSSYTDLLVKWSTRTDRSGFPSDQMTFRFNNVTTNNNYGFTNLNSSGSSRSSSSSGNVSYIEGGNGANAPTSTANNFSNGEIYIPNYVLSSVSKPVGLYVVTENNASTSNGLSIVSGIFLPTSAINRIDIGTLFGTNFVAGSTFYLYGIKNS